MGQRKVPGLKKRGQIWHIDKVICGKRICRSTGTQSKKEAQEFLAQLEADTWRCAKLKEKPRRRWQEAAVQWLSETSHKRTHQGDIDKLKWIDPYLRDKYLDEIDRELIESIARAKEAEGREPATVNRYLALIRSILRAAWQKWEWIDKVPMVRMRTEAEIRIRFLTQQEATRLLGELPEHLSYMAHFALMTGLRMNNVVRLKWSQINMEKKLAWIHPDESKTGNAIGVPLNNEAIDVLKAQLGKHLTYVFTYKGKPVLRASTHAWYKACERAEIEDFRFHDLRHTWASWHAQNGTPLNILQEMGGWRSTEMVKRYAHLSTEHLLKYVENSATHAKLTQTDLKVVQQRR